MVDVRNSYLGSDEKLMVCGLGYYLLLYSFTSLIVLSQKHLFAVGLYGQSSIIDLLARQCNVSANKHLVWIQNGLLISVASLPWIS